MKWISSTGGPLVLMEKRIIGQWGGIERTSKGNYECDYDRACEVRDYTGRIELETAAIAVLNEMPLDTTIWNTKNHEQIIARWRWARNQEAVVDCLRDIPENLFENPEECIEYPAKDDTLILFDASLTQHDNPEMLKVKIHPSRYRLITKVYEPDEETCLVLHHLSQSWLT